MNVALVQWRQGRRVGRCIHAMVHLEPSEDDVLIGVFDSPEISAHIVALHNRALDAEGQPELIDGSQHAD